MQPTPHKTRRRSGHSTEPDQPPPHAAPTPAHAAAAAASAMPPPPPAAAAAAVSSLSPQPAFRAVHARRNSRSGAAVGAILSSSQTFSAAALAAIHEPEAEGTPSDLVLQPARTVAAAPAQTPAQQHHARPPPITAVLGRRRGSGSIGSSSASSSSAGFLSSSTDAPGSSGDITDHREPVSASAALSSSQPRSHAARLLNSQRHGAAPPAPPATPLTVSITSAHAGALSLRSPKGSSGGSGGSAGGSGRGSGNTNAIFNRGSGDRMLRAGPGSAGGSARSSGGRSSSSSSSASSESSARNSSNVPMQLLPSSLSFGSATASGPVTPLSAKMILSPAAAAAAGPFGFSAARSPSTSISEALPPSGRLGPSSSSPLALSLSRSRSQSKETPKQASGQLQPQPHLPLTPSSAGSPRTTLPLPSPPASHIPSDSLSIALARIHATVPHHPAVSHDAILSPDLQRVASPVYAAAGAFSPPQRRMSAAASLSPSNALRTAPIAITVAPAAGASPFLQQHHQQVASPSSAFSERVASSRGLFQTSASYSSGLSSFLPHASHAAGTHHPSHGVFPARSPGAAVAIPATAASAALLPPSYIRPGSFPRTASILVLPPLTPSSHPMTPGPAHQPPEFDLELDAVPLPLQPMYMQRTRAATVGSTPAPQTFQVAHAAAAATGQQQAQVAREPPPPHALTSVPRSHSSASNASMPPLASVVPAAVGPAAAASASPELLLFSTDPAVGVGLLMTDKLRARQWGPLLADADDVLAPSSIDPRDLAQAQDLHPVAVLSPLALPQPLRAGLLLGASQHAVVGVAAEGEEDCLDALCSDSADEDEDIDFRSPRPPKGPAAAAAAAVASAATAATLSILDPHLYLSAHAYTAHALPPDPIAVTIAAVAAAHAPAVAAHRSLPSMDLTDLSGCGVGVGVGFLSDGAAGVTMVGAQKKFVSPPPKIAAAGGLVDSPSASPSASPSTSSSLSRFRSHSHSNGGGGGGGGGGSGRSHESHSSVDSSIEALNVSGGPPPMVHHLRPLASPATAQHVRAAHTLRLDEGLLAFTPSPRVDASAAAPSCSPSSSSALSARVKTPSGLALALAAVVASDVVPLPVSSSSNHSSPSPRGLLLQHPQHGRARTCSCTPPLTATSFGSGSSGGRHPTSAGSSADSPGTGGCCPLHGGRGGSVDFAAPASSSSSLHSPVGARSLGHKSVRALAPLSPTSPLRAEVESPSSPVAAIGSGVGGGVGSRLCPLPAAGSSGSSVVGVGHPAVRRPSLRSNIIPQPLSPGPQR